MLSKESKIRTLENFHALDYVFFGKPITEITSCCPLVKEEYMSIKGALLSVHIEMLKLVEHTPEVIDEKVNSSELIKQAKSSARIARENSQAIVTTDKSRDYIKQTLKEMFKEDKALNLVEEMQNQIRQQAFSLAVDNLLIGRIIDESAAFDKLNEWEGTIIEDSYKILRSNLVESAYEILESFYQLESDKKKVAKSVNEEIEANWKVGALIGFLTPIPGGIIAGALIGDWMQKNKRKLEAYCSKQKNPTACMAAGNQAMRLKLQQAKAKRSAKQEGKLTEDTSLAKGAAYFSGGVAAGATFNYLQCKKLYPNDPEKQKKCRKAPIWKRKKV